MEFNVERVDAGYIFVSFTNHLYLFGRVFLNVCEHIL